MNPFQRQELLSETHARQEAEDQNQIGDAGSEHGSDIDNENRRPAQVEQKKKKQGKPRFRIQARTLREPNKGLRLLYNSMNKLKLDQQDNRTETDLLNQFLRLYKEWHFNLAPKYDINYFISRCQDFGRDAEIRTYLQRMRGVHIGSNKWEDFADEEDQYREQEEGKSGDTQQIQETQNSQPPTQGQLFRPQGLPQTQNNQRPWNTQSNQMNRMNPTAFQGRNSINMNNQGLRDRNNNAPPTQHSLGATERKAPENQRTQFDERNEDYEEFDRIIEQEQKARRDIVENDFVDMDDDFGMGGNDEDDYVEPQIPDLDDEPVLDEKDLEYPIKKLKI